MAGRGMGAATRGGGCVGSGPRNKKVSSPSPKVEVMMARGGMANRSSMDTGRRAARPQSVPPMPATGMPKAVQKGGQKLMAKGGMARKTRANTPIDYNEARQNRAIREPKRAAVAVADPNQKGVFGNPKKKMGGGMIKKYRKGGMSKKTRADMPTGGRTRSVGIGGDTSRTAMRFKKNHPGVVKSLGYSKGGKVKGYRKGGMCK